MASSISIISAQTSVVARKSATFNYELTIDVSDPNELVQVDIELYVNGEGSENIKSTDSLLERGSTTVENSISTTFGENSGNLPYPRTDKVFITAKLYYGDNSSQLGPPEEDRSTGDREIKVTEPEVSSSEIEDFSDDISDDSPTSISDTFQNRTPFAIREIEYEDDASYLTSVYTDDAIGPDGFKIEGFEYSNPKISIDGAGRFVKHEIIGGATVRQKVGEDPINISINGVCKRTKANQIDSLRDAKSGKIYSDRLPGDNDSFRVQFGSTMTEPIDDGGAADITDGKYLYSFQINCIEVIR